MFRIIQILVVSVLAFSNFATAQVEKKGSESSQSFLSILDKNKSGQLEAVELENGYNVTSIGECLTDLVPKDFSSSRRLHLWYFIFEKGKVPKTISEILQFLSYSGNPHHELSADLKKIEVALEIFANAGCTF